MNPSSSAYLNDVGQENPGYGAPGVIVTDPAYYENERTASKSRWPIFGLGVLIGFGLGASVALLLAPRTGRETWKLLQATSAVWKNRTADAVVAANLPDRIGTLADRTGGLVASARIPERITSIRMPENVLLLPVRLSELGIPEAAVARVSELRRKPLWRRWRAA